MVNICFSGNKAVFEGLLMSIMSLSKYSDEDLNIHILTMDLSDENPNFLPFSDEQFEILNEVVKEKNPNSKVQKVDVTKYYVDTLREGKEDGNETYRS